MLSNMRNSKMEEVEGNKFKFIKHEPKMPTSSDRICDNSDFS